MIDERLTGGLAVIVSQLPPLIQRLLDPNSDQAARHTRYQLFAALSQFTAEDGRPGYGCSASRTVGAGGQHLSASFFTQPAYRGDSSPTKSRGLCCQLLNGTIC